MLDEPISVLDVSGRKNSNRGKIFYGISSVPDIGIVQENFNNHSNDNGNVDNLHEVLGCIEIKNIDSDIKKSKLIDSLQSVLEKIKNNTYKKADNSYFIDEQEYIGFTGVDIEQLLRQVLWYRKVLYTNGKEWKYFEVVFSNENSKSQYLVDIKEFSYSENSEDYKKYKDGKKTIDRTWFRRLSNAGDGVKWIQNVNIYEENLFLESDYNRSDEQAWSELKNSIRMKFV